MCTVTLLKTSDEFLLTMNRDERHERPAEEPPRVVDPSGRAPRCVWPIDSKSGGTWIGMNARGLTACLLNGYLPGDAQPTLSGSHLSRGAIVPDVLRHGVYTDALHWLQHDFEPWQFGSFTLLIAAGLEATAVTWRGGRSLEFHSPAGNWSLWSSSSWNADEVLPWRRREFDRWIAEGARRAEGMPAYHLLQPEGMAEWSPLMHRSYSATRSITQVARRTDGPLEMRYWQKALAQPGKPAAVVSLPVTV